MALETSLDDALGVYGAFGVHDAVGEYDAKSYMVGVVPFCKLQNIPFLEW